MGRASRSEPGVQEATVRGRSFGIRSICSCEQGQLVEYTTILVFVSIVGVALLTAVGLRVEELLGRVLDGFP
jgi:hypothetical protein